MECQRSRGRLTRHLILAGAEAKNSVLRALCLSCDMQVNISHRLAWIMHSGKGYSSHKSLHLSIYLCSSAEILKQNLTGKHWIFKWNRTVNTFSLVWWHIRGCGVSFCWPGIVLKYLITPFLPVGNTVVFLFLFFFNLCSVTIKFVNASREAFCWDREYHLSTYLFTLHLSTL